MDVVRYALELAGANEASDALKRTGESAETSAVSFAGLQGATALVGTAMIAATVAAFQWAQQIADTVNDINDLSTRTGVASETITGLRLAFEGSGQSAQQLEGVLQQVTQRMAGAARGTSEAIDGFEALGVSVTDANGDLRSTDTVLRETLERLQAIEDPTQRATAATNALGRSGARLVQALGDGALNDYVDAARAIGVDIGPAATAATAAWQREVATLNTTLESTPQRIAEAFGADTGGSGILETFNTALLFSLNLLEEGSNEFVNRFDIMGRAVEAFTSGDLSGAAGLVGDLYSNPFSYVDRATAATEEQLKALDALRGSGGSTGGGGSGTGGLLGSGASGSSAGGWTDGGLLNQLTNPGAITGSNVASGFSGLTASLDFSDPTRLDLARARAARFQAENPNAAGNLQAGAGALGGLATGNVNPLLSLIPGGGLLGGVANVGALGADGVGDMLDTFTEAFTTGLEALPEILGEIIPEFAVTLVTELIPALIAAAPEIFASLILGIVDAITPGERLTVSEARDASGVDDFLGGDVSAVEFASSNPFSPAGVANAARTSSTITRPRAPIQGGGGQQAINVVLSGEMGALIDRIDIEQGPNGTRPRSA